MIYYRVFLDTPLGLSSNVTVGVPGTQGIQVLGEGTKFVVEARIVCA